MAVTRRRPEQRGAAIFIVVLVVTLLTTLGLFAARNAAQVNLASGHARQATQSLYYAEMATELGIAQIDGPQAGAYVSQMTTSKDAVERQCMANALAGPTQTPYCYRILDTEVLDKVNDSTGLALTDLHAPQTTTAPGSFGPALPRADVTGDDTVANVGRDGVFVIELTDVAAGLPPAGENVDTSALRPAKIGLTAFAQLRTTPNDFDASTGNRWCGNDVSARSATVMAVRAYVTVMIPQ